MAPDPIIASLSDSVTKIDLERFGVNVFPAVVPGNLEIDLGKAGLAVTDPFFGMNVDTLRHYESCHMWYTLDFTAESERQGEHAFLVLEGVDCFADIFVNRQLVARLSNMLIPHEIDITGLLKPRNELFIHIRPALLEARKYPLGPGNVAQEANFDSLHVRKAPHMYGWDIMPRALSAGLWRPVRIEWRPEARIGELALWTRSVTTDSAQETLWYRLDGVDLHRGRYELDIEGVCGDSIFTQRPQLLGTAGHLRFDVGNARLWWPKGRGDANLYDVTVRLLNNGEEIDRRQFRHGMRTIELSRTEIIDDAGVGDFVFWVNGERVFVLGTNWVPLDAYHSRDAERLDAAIALLDECGCNMVRCWGGNVYESARFFDLCDERGVLVWQDFAMACGAYPQDDDFAQRIEVEARAIARRIRNHASLAVWCGDNECDAMLKWGGFPCVDPNQNRITREVLPRVLRECDPSRPYLPSSPYIGPKAFANRQADLPEQHLWGERRYYKAPGYLNARARFASEIGYHGCPSVESIKKFISADKLWPIPNDEWTLHATSPIPGVNLYDYRIKLMLLQIGDLFGTNPESLEQFSSLSQCVQAEAMKFFVERFRSRKWATTGIIWWNLIDGWPQFSDAVVDYFYDKKLAFDWIARAQRPLHVVVAEQERTAPLHKVVACNDTRGDIALAYSIRSICSGSEILAGNVIAAADSVTDLGTIERSPMAQDMYAIEWECKLGHGNSHYLAGDPPFDAATYLRWLIESLPGGR